MTTPKLTRDILLAALAGFQLDKQRIDAQIAEVQALLNGGATRETTLRGTVPSISEAAHKKGTRKRSAAVRKRMAEAQRLRWLKIKGQTEPEPTSSEPATPEASSGKRKKFSAAARRRMAEGQRLRYLKLKGHAEPESISPGPATPEAPKAKRKISAEGLKNIIAATKKRWRLQKAAAKAQSAPMKKAAPKNAIVKKASTAKAATKSAAVKRAVKKQATKKPSPVPIPAEAVV
jgi:hypothetical protein